jgi:hypothetical protein
MGFTLKRTLNVRSVRGPAGRCCRPGDCSRVPGCRGGCLYRGSFALQPGCCRLAPAPPGTPRTRWRVDGSLPPPMLRPVGQPRQPAPAFPIDNSPGSGALDCAPASPRRRVRDRITLLRSTISGQAAGASASGRAKGRRTPGGRASLSFLSAWLRGVRAVATRGAVAGASAVALVSAAAALDLRLGARARRLLTLAGLLIRLFHDGLLFEAGFIACLH